MIWNLTCILNKFKKLFPPDVYIPQIKNFDPSPLVFVTITLYWKYLTNVI